MRHAPVERYNAEVQTDLQVPRRMMTGGLRSLHAAGSDWEEVGHLQAPPVFVTPLCGWL